MRERDSVDVVSTPPNPASLLQLACFVRAFDVGSFAEAGRRLGLTTSGVSKAIGRLEAEHGVRLFHRSTHSLSLTDEGEQLLEECRNLVRGYDRVQSMLSNMAEGGIGRVRISAPPGFARKWLLPVLGRLLEEHPAIELDIRSAYAVVDIAQDGVDLALRTGAMHGLPGLFSQRLLSFWWCVYASPEYLARHGEPLHPRDLHGHRLLGFRTSPTGRAGSWQFRHSRVSGDGSLSIDVNAPIVFDDGSAAYDMAVAGHGLTWAPEWLASEDLKTGSVVEVLADWRSDEQIVSIVRRDRQLTPRRLRLVLEALQKAAKLWQVRGGALP